MVICSVMSCSREARADRRGPDVPIGEPIAEDSPSAGLLYVQRAASGRSTTNNSGAVTLELDGIDADTIWFQDRPGRDAGRLSTNDFVDTWAATFGDDPPNAALEIVDDNGARSTHVLELDDPTLTGTGRLTYLIVPARDGGAPLPAEFNDATLFIDDAPPYVYQPVTFSISNVMPGQQIAVLLQANGTDVAFSSGPAQSDQNWVDLTSPMGNLSFQQLSVSNSEVTLSPSFDDVDAGPTQVQVRLYAAAAPGTETFFLQSNSDPGVQVTASFSDGMQVPLSDAPTLIQWNP
jgi:hypothetical protein